MNEEEKALKGSRVLILGVAYKADVGDLRESPALDLIRLLHKKGAKVTYHDPYVPRLEVDGQKIQGYGSRVKEFILCPGMQQAGRLPRHVQVESSFSS